MTRVVRRKAFAYITHGGRLLLFRQPHAPEAGIQVPAGSIHEDESPEAAVMREAWEETGLDGLTLVRCLGERVVERLPYGQNELHHRYFFHLRCDRTPPEHWQHYEPDPSDGSEPPLFELFWAALPDGVPELKAEHGALLPELTAGPEFERPRGAQAR